MRIKRKKLILMGILSLFLFRSSYAKEKQFIVTRSEMGFTYKLNLTDATIKLDVIKELSPGENRVCNKLYPDYITAISAAKKLGIPVLPSVQLIWGKTKQFNDGLYASLEENLEIGIGLLHQGKINFLKSLLKKLIDYQRQASGFEKEVSNLATAYIICGLLVSGERIDVPIELEDLVKSMRQDFLQDETKSKVVGFFTWSDLLKRVFLQDRFYQRILEITDEKETAAAALISHTIITDPKLSKQYTTILEFYRRMTNPFSISSCEDYAPIIEKCGGIKKILSSKEEAEKFRKSLEKIETRGVALFPFSYSKETELMKKAGEYVPMASLIKFIQSGRISLVPTKESGFYDYQQYALETLVLPDKAEESRKLVLTEEYKKYLEGAFGAMLTQARETHIKQLEITEGIEITTFPKLTIEPLATVYLRTARGYKFLLENLPKILGNETLNAISRKQEDGSYISIPVLKEIKEIMLLMYGLYLLSCQDLGLLPQIDELSDKEKGKAENIARIWVKGLKEDKDLKKDTRVIVPLFRDYNPFTKNLSIVNNWATVGIKFLKIKAEYEKKPKVISVKGAFPIDFVYEPQYYLIPIDVFMEITRTKKPFVFTRTEFRKLCNQYKTEKAIKSVLNKDLIISKKLSVFVFFIVSLLLCAVGCIWIFRKRKIKEAKDE